MSSFRIGVGVAIGIGIEIIRSNPIIRRFCVNERDSSPIDVASAYWCSPFDFDSDFDFAPWRGYLERGVPDGNIGTRQAR